MRIKCIKNKGNSYIQVDIKDDRVKIFNELFRVTNCKCKLCRGNITIECKQWGVVPDMRIEKGVINFHLVCDKCFRVIRKAIRSLKKGKKK